MNVRIPKEKIIYFNSLYVYFLEEGKVYRGRRKVNYRSFKEHNIRLTVRQNSIKEIKRFPGKSNMLSTQKTGKILKKYGVEMY